MLPTEIDIPCFCPGCGSVTPLRVPREGFLRWQDGATTTEAFPALSPDDRERLISGLCPRCWSEWTTDPDPS